MRFIRLYALVVGLPLAVLGAVLHAGARIQAPPSVGGVWRLEVAAVRSEATTRGPERVGLRIVESAEPLEAAVEEARRGYDLIVIGASGDWGLEPTLFGARHERLAEVTASMLIVRRASPEEPRATVLRQLQRAVAT